MAYTLLEVIENPRRINNIGRDSLFDYLEEASKDQERFNAYMQMLDNFVPWAYSGIMLAASDIYSLKALFGDEIKNVGTVKYDHGSVGLLPAIKMIYTYYEIGNIVDEVRRAQIMTYAESTLASDDHRFFIRMLKQDVSKKVMKALKQYKEDGLMQPRYAEYFKFSYEEPVLCDPGSDFSYFIPVSNLSTKVKCENVLYEMDGSVSSYNLNMIYSELRKNGINTFALPLRCYIYFDGDEAVAFQSPQKMYYLKKCISSAAVSLADVISKNPTHILDCDIVTGEIKGCASKENKELVERTLEVKSSSVLAIPVQNNIYRMLQCVLKDDSLITISTYTGFEKAPGKKIKVIEHNQVFYLLE